MSRIVQKITNHNGVAVNRLSEWGERVAKYLPAEVLAFYLPLNTLIDLAGPNEASVKPVAYAFIFLVGLIATNAFLFKAAKPQRPPKKQLIISSIAFVLWAYYLGGIFTVLGWHDSLIASLAVGAFTLAAGWFEP